MALIIDTSRIDNVVKEAKKRAEEVYRFTIERVLTLNQKEAEFVLLVKNCKGKELEFSNLYSTHMQDEQYTDRAAMIAHASFKLEKLYRGNLDSTVKMVENVAKNIFSGDVNITVGSIRVNKELKVSFQIWVR